MAILPLESGSETGTGQRSPVRANHPCQSTITVEFGPRAQSKMAPNPRYWTWWTNWYRMVTQSENRETLRLLDSKN